MELLNLDELVVVKREVTIGGVNYPLAEQTLGQMISADRLKKTMDDQKEDDLGAMAQKIIDVASTIVPTCPVEKLMALKPRQLFTLINFATAEDSEAVAVARNSASTTHEEELTKKS